MNLYVYTVNDPPEARRHRHHHSPPARESVYTVNDPPEARRLVALGIDGLITDAVDRFSLGNEVHD